MPPATLTDVNLVAADMGGAVEALSGSYGSGLTGHRLIDGRLDDAWSAPEGWNPNMMYGQDYWVKYPQEAVFSFYERRPALVGAVAVTPPVKPVLQVEDSLSGPANVEIWTSMDTAPERFHRVATATLDPRPGEQTIPFPATEARFVKLRILSGASARIIELAEVRVLESTREGYAPLFDREPRVKVWKGSPREAAQRGLDWLQQSAVNWGSEHSDGCFGCHVQAQALMGQAVALKQGYRVSLPAMRALTDLMRKQTTPQGRVGQQNEILSSTFGAMGFAEAAEASGRASDRELLYTVDYLLSRQTPDGSIPFDANPEPPIEQGELMLTGNALMAIKWAAAHSPDPKYRQAAEPGTRLDAPRAIRSPPRTMSSRSSLSSITARRTTSAWPGRWWRSWRPSSSPTADGRKSSPRTARTRLPPVRCCTRSSRRASAFARRCSGAAWSIC